MGDQEIRSVSGRVGMYGIRFGGKPLSLLQGETAFLGGIFCLEYLSRRSEKGNPYFANYRFSP